MLYRLKSCQGLLRSSGEDGDMPLYRGVSYSQAINDLDRSRLFFSQAVSHNGSDASQEGEALRSHHEWTRICHELQISEDDSMQSAHAGFFDKGDQYARGCYFISCWSRSEPIAIGRFAYKYSDKAVISIQKSDLECAFKDSVTYWNSKQPGESDMHTSDGSLNLDWDQRYIGYAAGPVSYVELGDPSNYLPFRLARAMRLPDWSGDEEEWRIALDLSLIPSSIYTSASAEAGLMSSSISQIAYRTLNSHQAHDDSAQAELEPMIDIITNNFPGYTRGLWLNHCDLRAQDSFQINKI